MLLTKVPMKDSSSKLIVSSSGGFDLGIKHLRRQDGVCYDSKNSIVLNRFMLSMQFWGFWIHFWITSFPYYNNSTLEARLTGGVLSIG